MTSWPHSDIQSKPSSSSINKRKKDWRPGRTTDEARVKGQGMTPLPSRRVIHELSPLPRVRYVRFVQRRRVATPATLHSLVRSTVCERLAQTLIEYLTWLWSRRPPRHRLAIAPVSSLRDSNKRVLEDEDRIPYKLLRVSGMYRTINYPKMRRSFLLIDIAWFSLKYIFILLTRVHFLNTRISLLWKYISSLLTFFSSFFFITHLFYLLTFIILCESSTHPPSPSPPSPPIVPFLSHPGNKVGNPIIPRRSSALRLTGIEPPSLCASCVLMHIHLTTAHKFRKFICLCQQYIL